MKTKEKGYGRGLDIFLLPVACVLLALVLLSCWQVAGLYAKYTTSDTISGSARVAKFEVIEAGIEERALQVSVRPGERSSTVIQVENKSEVAVQCTVTADSTSDNIVPLSFDVSDPEATLLAPGDTKDVTISYEWPTTSSASNLTYMGMVDYITVTVTTAQVD